MKLDKGIQSLTTYTGFCFTVFLTLAMVVYTLLKINVLIYKTEIDILATKLDYYYDDSFVFDQSMGLYVAVAFSGYNNKREYELDKSIGEIVYISYEWGYDEDGNTFLKRERIPSHVCTKEELGLEGDSSNFYPLMDGYKSLRETY